ncbi:MAG: iron response transcriptional regulator IrrA [Hyphomicrobium sp.]
MTQSPSPTAGPATTDTEGTGHPQRSVPDVLRQAGLRPTRQRRALGGLLFGGEDRHVTAEQLHAEAAAEGEHVSLATVYNTLHQFKKAGLVRELAIEGSKAYFDTNTSNHNHFLLEPEGRLMDIDSDAITVSGLPEPPEGMKITHIDVVVRLAKK